MFLIKVGAPEPYNFNFDVKDDYGNNQFRREEGDSTGAVRGSYGYTDANGVYRIVDYIADDNGFRGKITFETVLLVIINTKYIISLLANIRTNEPGLVEPSPATGVVESPADVRLSPESSPARVREEQARYTSRHSSSSYGSSSSAASASSSFGSSGRYSTKY